jgi:probable phosphomutase (TIGR03848 family)
VTTLLLIRHANTDAAGKRLMGWSRGVHLNERGRREAAALVERLEGVPIRAVYTSPLERCRETAAPFARARGLSVSARRGLLEVDYGEWTGRTIADVRRTRLWRVVQHTPSRLRFPGGESLLDVQARAVAEIERIAVAHPRDVVAVVTHADVVRLALLHFAGMHVDSLHRLHVDTASVSVLVLQEGGVRLVKVNDTGGLGDLVPRRGGRAKVRG